jgi:hypothetical protein
MRQRPIRSQLYLPILRFGITDEDWGFVILAGVTGYAAPFALGLRFYHLPAELIGWVVTMGLSVLALNVIRMGQRQFQLLIVAADTGLRRNELFTIESTDLNFEDRVITVRAINAKTNRPRQIPMAQRVYEELKKLCEKNPSGKVFGGLVEVKRSFRTACKLAGIEDLHLHDFRHAFVSRSILAGVPPAVALKASGHASDEWKRYLNVTPNQLQNLLKPIGDQKAEEVKSYGMGVLRQLREALGYDEIADLITLLNDR